ncbi:MAG: extracellular solute-binding protein [Candidatus Rokubacteria bacterium]|nr:extracellular solute-binding protein [Candidatus Rokubacteria bacterium]
MRLTAVAVATLALLAGCGERAARDAPVTVVFKHARMFGDDPVPRLVAAFEARHPGVRVRTEALGSSSDEQHQFFVINLEGSLGRGRGPGFDVMMLDVIWVPEFARAGWLLDLTPWLEPPELDPHFPAAAAAARWDGRVWALPWNFNVGLLYYRADLLARHGLAPPTTDVDLAWAVRRIQAVERDPKLDGYLWQGKQYEGLTVNALEALWASGTTLLGPRGEVFPDAGRAEGALAMLRGWVARGISPPWVSAADEELTRRAFGDGRAIFLRNWPYAMDLFQAVGSPVRGKVGIAPLPRRLLSVPAPGSTGGSHLGVSRSTRHPEASVAFARFLAAEEAQRILAGGSVLPTRRRLYHDPALVATRPHMPVLHDLALAGRPRPVTPAYLMLSTSLQPELSAAVVGVKSPARAVTDARRQLAYILSGLE